MGWKFYSLIRMIFPPIRSSAISSTGCSNKRNGEMLGENFRISTSSCAESCTSEQRRERKGGGGQYRGNERMEVERNLGRTHGQQSSSSTSSSSRVLAGNDTLSRKSRGWNERASLSASNCNRVVVEEIVDPFTILAYVRRRKCSRGGRKKKEKKRKRERRGIGMVA